MRDQSSSIISLLSGIKAGMLGNECKCGGFKDLRIETDSRDLTVLFECFVPECQQVCEQVCFGFLRSIKACAESSSTPTLPYGAYYPKQPEHSHPEPRALSQQLERGITVILTDFTMVSLLQHFREIKNIQIIGVLFCRSNHLVYEIQHCFKCQTNAIFLLSFCCACVCVCVCWPGKTGKRFTTLYSSGN